MVAGIAVSVVAVVVEHSVRGQTQCTGSCVTPLSAGLAPAPRGVARQTETSAHGMSEDATLISTPTVAYATSHSVPDAAGRDMSNFRDISQASLATRMHVFPRTMRAVNLVMHAQ